MNAPVLLLDATGNPRRFGSVASCYPGALGPGSSRLRWGAFILSVRLGGEGVARLVDRALQRKRQD